MSELVIIVKFRTKYSHILNAKRQSIVDMDYKPLVRFLHMNYHKDIFACWANKLHLLNICIQHIAYKKNIVANNLFRIIFNNLDCSANGLVSKLAKEVFTYSDNHK